MDRSRLETRLKAVQDLKEEKYIGTGEAWNYLKKIEILYENPKAVATLINEGVAREMPVLFEATPARIMGLSYGLNRAYGNSRSQILREEIPEELEDTNDLIERDFIEMLQDKSPLSKVLDRLIIYTSHIVAWGKQINHFYESPPNPQEVAADLIPHFREFHQLIRDKREFATNQGLAFFIATKAAHMNDLDRFYQEMQGEHQRSASLSDFNNIFMGEVVNLNWESLMSQEGLRMIEGELRRFVELDTLDLNRRVDRIIRDQIDHRLESRREMITDFLAREGHKSYDEAVASLKDRIRKKRELIEMNAGIGLGDDNPLNFGAKDQITRTTLLLHALTSDRNFVKRFLEA